MNDKNQDIGWDMPEQDGNTDYLDVPIEAIAVFLDLDNFKNLTERLGWTKDSPNPCTGTLTTLVSDLTRKFNGQIAWGIDPIRGTEEVMIFFTFVPVNHVIIEVEKIQQEIANIGFNCTLSAGIAYTNSFDVEIIKKVIKWGNRGKSKHPLLILAKKQCRMAKKKGGNCIETLML